MKTKQTAQWIGNKGQFAMRDGKPVLRIPDPAPAQAQHSPLPFRNITSNVYSSDSLVCETITVPDASFIVRACNNAQRLADALTPLISALDYYAHTKNEAVMTQAREALAEWSKQK